MKKIPKDVLSNVANQLYELRCEISHECCMGRLNPHKVSWITGTIGDIEAYIYENSKCS